MLVLDVCCHQGRGRLEAARVVLALGALLGSAACCMIASSTLLILAHRWGRVPSVRRGSVRLILCRGGRAVWQRRLQLQPLLDTLVCCMCRAEWQSCRVQGWVCSSKPRFAASDLARQLRAHRPGGKAGSAAALAGPLMLNRGTSKSTASSFTRAHPGPQASQTLVRVCFFDFVFH